MTISNGYATLVEVKARLGLTDTASDAILEAVVEAASRWIDGYTGRRFYTTAADETRTFTAEWWDVLDAEDLVSITSLKTDADGDRVYETTWATTDYDLEPYNAAPYTLFRVTPNGRYRFPLTRRGVEVVGKWGYSAVPDAVNEACLLQSERLFRRKDTPFGVAGVGELGQTIVITGVDPDVKQLLAPFRKTVLGSV